MSEWFLFENNSKQEAFGVIDPCSTYNQIIEAISAFIDDKTLKNIYYQRGQTKVEIKESTYKFFYEYYLKPPLKPSLNIFITFEKNKKCEIHYEYQLDAFCVDCKILICYKCLTLNHQQHECKTWDDHVESVKNVANDFETFEKLKDKSNYLKSLIGQLEEHKLIFSNEFITFKNETEEISQNLSNKIVSIKDNSQNIYDDILRNYLNKLESLNSIIEKIVQISSNLNQNTDDFTYLKIISDANQILNKDYSDYEKKEKWNLSLDRYKLEEFLNNIFLTELNFLPDKTEVLIEEQNDIFVQKSFEIKILTKNLESKICIKGVEKVQILNIRDGVFYDCIYNHEQQHFSSKIIPKKKGKLVIFPVLNNLIVPNSKCEVYAKSNICIEKTKASGWLETYNHKSPLSISIKTYDNLDNPLNYGQEKFKILIYQDQDPNHKEEIDSIDNKDGTYQIYTLLNFLGPTKISIKLEQVDQNGTKTFENIPNSPFIIEIKENHLLNDAKNLGVSEEYVPDWKVWEGVRELMQNWRDGIIENQNCTINDTDFTKAEDLNAIHYDVKYQNSNRGHLIYNKTHKTLILKNKGVISRSCLALGKSNKRNDPNAAGHFGEGMKLAALSLLREQKQVTIITGSEKWIFSIRYDEIYSINMLFVKIENLEIFSDETEVLITNLTLLEFHNIISKLRFLVKRPQMTNAGELLVNEKSHIYVKSIFICKYEKLDYGYDIQSLKIDRDRKLIADENELYKSVVSVACEDVIKNGPKKFYDILNTSIKSYLSYTEFKLAGQDININKASNLLNTYLKNTYGNNKIAATFENDPLKNSYCKALSLMGLTIHKVNRVLWDFMLLGSEFRNYNTLFQDYLKSNYTGSWYRDLNTNERNLYNNAINQLKNLGLKPYYHENIKVKCGTPPFYEDFTSTTYNGNSEVVVSPKCFENIQKLSVAIAYNYKYPCSSYNFLK
jgi:hypothetical protein